jgi:hypothetical protein
MYYIPEPEPNTCPSKHSWMLERRWPAGYLQVSVSKHFNLRKSNTKLMTTSPPSCHLASCLFALINIIPTIAIAQAPYFGSSLIKVSVCPDLPRIVQFMSIVLVKLFIELKTVLDWAINYMATLSLFISDSYSINYQFFLHSFLSSFPIA